MHPATWLWLIPIITVIGLLWFLVDIKYEQEWGLKRAELGTQGKWKEINEHFEAAMRCRRPMLLLHRHTTVPGSIEAQYALHLSNQGENERALLLVQKASRKAVKKPTLRLSFLPSEVIILTRLGHYQQAREVIQLGRKVSASADMVELAKKYRSLGAGIVVTEALLEFNVGHLEKAIKLAVEASDRPVSDPARMIISGALAAQGRFKEALDATIFEPSDIYKIMVNSPPILKHQKESPPELLSRGGVFQQTIEKINEKLSSVFGPAIHLGRAAIFLETGDASNLEIALQRAQEKLKSNHVMKHIFVRTRACWHAMKGNVTELEADLARTRELAAEMPANRSVKYETHLGAGRARFLMAQYDAANEELKAATQLALHPIEKHISTYWLARASQAISSPSASKLFETVIADDFRTWMEADARVRLTQLASN